ncbi:MAG TPA: hypothetical protein VLF39_00640 [Candidatus Saccharimonadales bacterium]|nr:hypothetical protein [Candidatus Saccharimonadales bacterium]
MQADKELGVFYLTSSEALLIDVDQKRTVRPIREAYDIANDALLALTLYSAYCPQEMYPEQPALRQFAEENRHRSIRLAQGILKAAEVEIDWESAQERLVSTFEAYISDK